jgi:hypothetical protein
MPVVVLKSTHRCCVRREGGSGGVLLSAASASEACCCVLSSWGTAAGRSGKQDCVVLAFMRTWSNWTWCMAMDAGGYFHITADVNPGQVVKWPASIAAHHVDRDGE